MSCPTCSSTMQNLYQDDGIKRYWCPRCGTLKYIMRDGREDIEKPAIIERAIKFADKLFGNDLERDWISAGMEEAINLPNNRREAE